jgi:dTDP-4-amino-4,6-dideoxygalactose transaminase
MNSVKHFENIIRYFYGSPYAVAVDCCTHAIELCLRLIEPPAVTCPNHTYLSIPMTFEKLNLPWSFHNIYWKDYYYIGNTNIIDAAVYWKRNSYIPNTLMCLSFQYKKHLNVGRGGMILLDNPEQYVKLKKMRYDGRVDNIPWKEQDIDTMGYHYYMTPETAELGLERFKNVEMTEPKFWSWKDYPDLKTMKVFNEQQQ